MMKILLEVVDIDNDQYVGGIPLDIQPILALELADDYNSYYEVSEDEFASWYDGEIKRLNLFLHKNGFGKIYDRFFILDRRYRIEPNAWRLCYSAFNFE